MAEHRPASEAPRGFLKSAVTTVVLTMAIVVCWVGTLDERSRAETARSLKSTLVSYGLARTLNGVISVAQGTEIAIQPAGVGVVLTAGEILDPLNDLIERFSWIVLLAASSLAMQLLLGQMLATPFMNVVTTLAALACIGLCWLGGSRLDGARSLAFRLTALLIAIRFALVGAGLVTGAIGSAYLDQREQGAVEYLSATSEAIEQAETDHRAPGYDTRGLLERLDDFVATQKEALDLHRRLDQMQRRIEAAINEVINLIVVYLVKTILIPLFVLAGIWALVRRAWR